jgi:hypothetical protein
LSTYSEIPVARAHSGGRAGLSFYQVGGLIIHYARFTKTFCRKATALHYPTYILIRTVNLIYWRGNYLDLIERKLQEDRQYYITKNLNICVVMIQMVKSKVGGTIARTESVRNENRSFKENLKWVDQQGNTGKMLFKLILNK